jgi:hypothetical protein
MGVMKLELHPPLLARAPGDSGESFDFRAFVHARLWLDVELSDWQERRSGHLRLVRPVKGGEWRAADLAGHALRVAHGEELELTADEIEQELRSWFDRHPLRFYRFSQLGAVSEVGEGLDEFRRRVMGSLQPEVRRRLEEVDAGAPSLMPWRRRAREARRGNARRELAAGVAELSNRIEELAIEDAPAAVRRAEAGLLLVAAGVDLAPRHARDLMID